jgi:hypothetical protein
MPSAAAANKQTVEESKAELEREREEITPDLILKRFKYYNDLCAEIRKKNTEAGLDDKRNNLYAPPIEPISIKHRTLGNVVTNVTGKLWQQTQYEQFLQQVINPKTGSWYTVKSLTEAGLLSSIEASQLEFPEYPVVRLNSLIRVRDTSGKEWLYRYFTLYALTREGNQIHKSINDMDYYHLPQITRHQVAEDPPDFKMEGKTIFVADINTGKSSLILEPTTPRHYLMPFSVERVHQIIRDFPPVGNFSDKYNGCGLVLLKTGEANPMSVNSLEEFCEPFMTVWERLDCWSTAAVLS